MGIIEEVSKVKDQCKKLLPAIFGNHEFSFRSNKDVLHLKWKDGICVDRVIQQLEKHGINYDAWIHISFSREVSYSTDISRNLNNLGVDTDDYDTFITHRRHQKKLLRDFYPKYCKHLEDEAKIIAIAVKKTQLGYDDEEYEDEIRSEYEEFAKQNRFYLTETIVQSSASHQDVVFKVNASVERAFERFFEEAHIKMDAELSKKEEPNQPTFGKV